MAVHRVASLTAARYEQVIQRLTGKRRLESMSDLPFDGLLVHVAAETEDGFLIVDVFESDDAVDRFNDAMRTIPREAGIQEPPRFYPTHTFISR